MNRFSASMMSAVLAAGLAWSGAAFAQSTDSEAAPAEETSPLENQLSMGEDASVPSDLGQPYVRETIGAFEMRCLRTEDPALDPCQMYQMMDDGQGTPVAEFSLFRLPEGGQAKAGATVIVPLETALPNQLTVTVDGGKPRRYPFQFCNSLGCYVRVGLTEADVNAFKRGNTATLSIVPALAPDQRVDLALSLSGFTASYDKVTVLEQP